MEQWVLTDTHLGHARIQEYTQRPKGFEQVIIQNVATLVKPEDLLIHLGDFCFGDNEKWHAIFNEACKATKWLIRGNHDRKSLSWYLSHGWAAVADTLTLRTYRKTVLFSHRPVPCGDFDINIHGHHHNVPHHPEDTVTEKNRLLYIEHHYKPVNLRKLIEETQKETKKC